MQTMNRTRKCSNCGCVALFDSKTCPKCGNCLISRTYVFDESQNDFCQMSQILKLLQFSTNVNIRFSFVKKSRLDVDIFSACT